MLKIENLIANYGRIEALHGISLEVKEHEIVALIGSNGAGKTTLVKSVSGHVTKEGKIELAGENLSRLAPDNIAWNGVLRVAE
ncbi:MAG: ATP-binding cassette domain-containing protein, partial [Clostridia bacterium]|nr:ATP-binding cassette domain-containing protein [Clostridia bacterium]